MKTWSLVIAMVAGGCYGKATPESCHARWVRDHPNAPKYEHCMASYRRAAGIDTDNEFQAEAKAQVAARARIELGCDLVWTHVIASQGPYPVEVSAEGCGRSAMYQRTLRRHFGKLGTKNTTWETVALSPQVVHTPAPISADNEIPPSPY